MTEVIVRAIIAVASVSFLISPEAWRQFAEEPKGYFMLSGRLLGTQWRIACHRFRQEIEMGREEERRAHRYTFLQAA